MLSIPLELEGTEFRVEKFAADILARNGRTGARVLIENQLEPSDHTHLGQIMTYLAGLRAETMVWIAPSFSEPHLSAIRWLNEHTVDPFAFFAVKLRVVRIGDSPFAPLFEVIERPNNWDRAIEQLANETQQPSETALLRREFWKHYTNRHPLSAGDAVQGGGASRWRAVPGSPLVVSQWFGRNDAGVFIRGPRGAGGEMIAAGLKEHDLFLISRLGVELGDVQYPYLKRFEVDTADKANWDELTDWLAVETASYQTVLAELAALSNSEET